MPTKYEIEKRIANFSDPKSNGAFAREVERQKKNGTYGYYNKSEKDKLRSLVKFGVENSSTPVSKAPQGSKQHQSDILNYVNKTIADNEVRIDPKISNQKIFENNINRKEPVALKFASPKQVGQLAERLEQSRQMTGEMSTWDMMKATAKTAREKKEIRDIIKADYNKNGAKNMAQDDLKWIGKSKYQNAEKNLKIDVSGISDSINNYINAKRVTVPVAPPKKEIDPDLNLGLAALLGVDHGS